MDTVINSIIDMEHKAREVVEAAKAEREAMLEETKAHCEELRADIVKRQELRLSKIADNEQQIIDTKLAELTADNEKRLAALKKQAQENQDRWVEEIFARVVGGEDR